MVDGRLAGERRAASGALAIRTVTIATTTSAVATRGLKKALGGRPVLESVDLDVPTGCISAVLGPSGTGKSVLIRHLIGLWRPDAGSVRIQGRDLAGMSHADILHLRRDIGLMFQDGALFSSMNVVDNVAFPLRQHTSLHEPEILEITQEHLEAVGLAHAAHRYPSELSGGMRKRAGLARALALDPPIVICDEPDSGLDPVRTALLAELLRDRHEALGGTMVVITHDLSLVKAICDHVSVLWQGRVVQSGSAEQIWNSSDPFVQQFLGALVTGPLGMD